MIRGTAKATATVSPVIAAWPASKSEPVVDKARPLGPSCEQQTPMPPPRCTAMMRRIGDLAVLPIAMVRYKPVYDEIGFEAVERRRAEAREYFKARYGDNCRPCIVPNRSTRIGDCYEYARGTLVDVDAEQLFWRHSEGLGGEVEFYADGIIHVRVSVFD